MTEIEQWVNSLDPNDFFPSGNIEDGE